MCGLSLQDSQIEIGSISMFPWRIKSLSTTTHVVPFLNKHFLCSRVIPGVGQNPQKKIQKTPWMLDAGTLFSTSQMVFPWVSHWENTVPPWVFPLPGLQWPRPQSPRRWSPGVPRRRRPAHGPHPDSWPCGCRRCHPWPWKTGKPKSAQSSPDGDVSKGKAGKA